MAYVPTTFVDRSVEFPNRRKLTAVSGIADTFDVTRAEGTVFAAGTKLDAANLNAEFGKIKTETDAINSSLKNQIVKSKQLVYNVTTVQSSYTFLGYYRSIALSSNSEFPSGSHILAVIPMLAYETAMGSRHALVDTDGSSIYVSSSVAAEYTCVVRVLYTDC